MEPIPSDELGQAQVQHWVTTYVAPEIDRRVAANAWSPETPVSSAQILLRSGQPPEVRLNNEVALLARAKVNRPLDAGDDVFAEDIDRIEGYELLPDDSDAAHITLLAQQDGCLAIFSFTAHAGPQVEHLEAAREFVDGAREALAAGRLRLFAETAWSASELLIKAELHVLPDADLVANRRHSFLRHAYGVWARLGNSEERFAKLYIALDEMRAEARYLRNPFGLSTEQAEALLGTLDDFHAHVLAVCPGGVRADRLIHLRALRDLKAGELIGENDVRLRAMRWPAAKEDGPSWP